MTDDVAKTSLFIALHICTLKYNNLICNFKHFKYINMYTIHYTTYNMLKSLTYGIK